MNEEIVFVVRSPINKNVQNRNTNKPDELSESGKKKFASRCRLFVGNLSNEVKETDLREVFEKYGEVVECFMSGKGFGFVRLVRFHFCATPYFKFVI